MKAKRYNKALKKYTELLDGEEFCPVCKGKGTVRKYKKRVKQISPNLVCHKCLGNGKLDWIEKATGVAPIKHIDPYETLTYHLAQELAEQIDRDIIRSCIKSAEHNIKE